MVRFYIGSYERSTVCGKIISDRIMLFPAAGTTELFSRGRPTGRPCLYYEEIEEER